MPDKHPLNPNLQNPRTVRGASMASYVLIVATHGPFIIGLALLGVVPLIPIGSAFALWGVFAGLTSWDPFWAQRLLAWLLSWGATPGSPPRVYDYSGG